MDANALFELTPENYEHGRGMMQALNAAIDRIKVMAGTSFVEGHEEVARALRETAEQVTTARNKVAGHCACEFPTEEDYNLQVFQSECFRMAKNGDKGELMSYVQEVMTGSPAR